MIQYTPMTQVATDCYKTLQNDTISYRMIHDTLIIQIATDCYKMIYNDAILKIILAAQANCITKGKGDVLVFGCFTFGLCYQLPKN